MMGLWSKWFGTGRNAFASILIAGVLLLPCAAAEDGSRANTGESNLQQQIGEVFHRSMAHWRYDYSKIPDGKAGVACIPWQRLDAEFLDDAIFEALGFSYSMASEDGAIRVATQGCDQMRAHYKLTDCACELVFIGDRLVVEIPRAAPE